MTLPPIEHFYDIAAAGVVSGLVLFATWRWRRQDWPGGIAIGAGFAATFRLALDKWPKLIPADATRFALHCAVGGALLGVLLSVRRVPAILRWLLPLGASAVVVWLLLGKWAPNKWPDDHERMTLLCGLAVAMFVVWKILDGAARRRPGVSIPLFLMIYAGAVSLAVSDWGASALLGQFAAALAAALGPCVLFGLIMKDKSLGAGAVAVTTILSSTVLICAVYYGELAPWSALLFALAPVALVWRRPRWASAALFTMVLGTAMLLAWNAAQPEEEDDGIEDPYEDIR